MDGPCFFISTGGALATVPEETSCDLGLDEEGPSASLQAYVAATGALVSPPPEPTPPVTMSAQSAALCIQREWRRLREAYRIEAKADTHVPSDAHSTSSDGAEIDQASAADDDG